MTNDFTYQFILDMFRQIIQKASDFKIYDNGSVSVSVLSFFIALSAMFIVISALLNFVKTVSVDHSSENISAIHGRISERRAARRYYKQLKKNGGVDPWDE